MATIPCFTDYLPLFLFAKKWKLCYDTYDVTSASVRLQIQVATYFKRRLFELCPFSFTEATSEDRKRNHSVWSIEQKPSPSETSWEVRGTKHKHQTMISSKSVLLHSLHHQLSGSFYDDFDKKGIDKKAKVEFQCGSVILSICAICAA